MAETRKRAKRMSIDVNTLSTVCIQDIVMAFEEEKRRRDESPYPVTFGAASTLLMETLFLKGIITARGEVKVVTCGICPSCANREKCNVTPASPPVSGCGWYKRDGI